MSNKKIKVLVYPIADNPYQQLLYDHFPINDTVKLKMLNGSTGILGPLVHLPVIIAKLVFYRAKGYKVLHLHWLYTLEFPGYRLAPRISNAISTLQVLAFLVAVKFLGFKLGWTVHDLLPHDKRTFGEVKIAQRLVNQASSLILLSTATMEEMNSLGITYDKRKISIIPMGNYDQVYPNVISQQAARVALGIPKTSFVFVFFGRVEPYKNILGLIEAFHAISDQFPDAYLIIAGKVNNMVIQKQIETAVVAQKGKVIVNLNFIPDDEVQLYYNAADIGVFPFSEITNSSSTILTASFGKPIIAPRIGAIKDVPSSAGIFYDPKKAQGLELSMEKALNQSESMRDLGISASDYAKTLSWDKIAEQTYKVYKDVLSK